MGFVGFLKFTFKCFDLLAWPLFGLGCPLYASIRAIENNSNSEMRNLVAYWILFSLVSLFELAFVKLIQWLPFWSYMKLMAMCLLVLPDFNGASYAYECLIRPCLSVDLRVVMKYFIRPKEYKSLNTENFLAMAERYVQENGSEALEKLLDRKSEHTKPDIGMEEIKAMTNTEEKETAAAIQSNKTMLDIGMEEIKAMTNTEEKETPVAIQSKYEEPIVGKVDARAVEQPEKTPVAATKSSQVNEPSVGKENANTGQLKDKNPAVATEQVKRVEPNLCENEKKTVDAGEIKGKTVGAAGGENKAVETTGLEKVQREWTCALCQVRTTCEKNLHSHLQGRRHMEKRQELKASMQMNKTKCSSSSAASPEPRKTHNVDRLYDNRTKNQQYNVQVNRTNDQCREKQADLFFYREPEESKEQQEEEASVQEYDYGAAALGGGEQWNQLSDAQWPVEAPATAGAVATGWTQDAVLAAGDRWESAAGDGWGAAGDWWELAVPTAGNGWGAAGDGWELAAAPRQVPAAGDGWELAAAPRITNTFESSNWE